jgi:hypothetical protein
MSDGFFFWSSFTFVMIETGKVPQCRKLYVHGPTTCMYFGVSWLYSRTSVPEDRRGPIGEHPGNWSIQNFIALKKKKRNRERRRKDDNHRLDGILSTTILIASHAPWHPDCHQTGRNCSTRQRPLNPNYDYSSHEQPSVA